MDNIRHCKGFNLNPYRLTCVTLLISLTSVINIVCISYSTGLFLSAYPSPWLSYLYVAQGLGLGFVSLGVAPYAKKFPRGFCSVSTAACMGLVVLFYFLNLIPNQWLPFLICVGVFLISKIFGINAWNYAAMLLNVRDFKHYNAQILAISSVAGLIFGLILPLMIQVWGAQSALPLLAALCLCAMPVFLGTTPLPRLSKKSKQSENAFHYTLFCILFIAGLFIGISNIIVDFSFKSELAIGRTETQITQLTSVISALTNILTLGIQLFVIKRMQQRFGLVGLYLCYPISLIIFSLLYFAMPSLLTATLLYSVAFSVVYATTSSAREQALNALPQAIRISAKFIEKGLAKPAGNIIAAIITFIIGTYLQLSTAGLILIIFGSILITLAIQIGYQYQQTLAKALTLRRFDSLDLDEIATNKNQYLHFIDTALSAEEDELKLLGIRLYRHMALEAPPEKLLNLLNSHHLPLRAAVIKALSGNPSASVNQKLVDTLNKETDEKLCSRLLNAIEENNPELALEKAEHYLESASPILRATAISIILRNGELSQCLRAANLLEGMLKSNQHSDRAYASRSLSRLKIGNLTSTLKQLIADEDSKTSVNAIISAMSTPSQALIDVIIDQLARDKVRYMATQALITFDADAVSAIIQRFDQSAVPLKVSLIKVLSRILHPSAETALTHCIDTQSARVMNSLAKYCAYRASRMPLSPALIQFAENQLKAEVDLIAALNYLLTTTSLAFQHIEIRSRIKLAKVRFLYWLVTGSHTEMLRAITPLIAYLEQEKSIVFTTSLELVDTYLSKSIHSQYLQQVFEKPKAVSSSDKALTDPWLNEVLARDDSPIFHDIETMSPLDKIVALRKIPVFKSLDAAALQTIAEQATVMAYPMGHTLFQQGDPATTVYLLFAGDIELQAESGSQLYADHGFLGLMSLLSEETHQTTAVTHSDVLLLAIDHDQFTKLMLQYTEIAKALIQRMVNHLRTESPHGGVLF